ncbi:isoprenylcysteine carboxylmethyltransferase family protein [Ornithinimicrobium humiphilum]|uniref:Phospholipid methyltransferase n=1 Tax=Ornithinimicrobium humiphilum TaxID=125288 RepID=A0A543K841_9MICO|nr:isoprenylcysteine carboxylmethyltransferase family protein [Ornithinimicrobium humiphilum]TQM91203.1 phospholipid methyltransferase [Ornithinimicrobium humiphilum]
MRVPPVVHLAGAALAQRTVGRPPTRGSLLASAPFVAASGWLAGGAVREFVRRGTTVDPMTVDRASTLVRTGPNAVTRNPMYLGMAVLLTGHAVARRSPLALLPVAGLVAALDHWQIPAEEAALAQRFEDYAGYVASVPRWL